MAGASLSKFTIRTVIFPCYAPEFIQKTQDVGLTNSVLFKYNKKASFVPLTALNGPLNKNTVTGGKSMLKKVQAFIEKKLPFLFDDDLQFKVRDFFRLLSDLIVWPVNYVKSFFK